MKKDSVYSFIFVIAIFIFSACDKGYTVRFTNFYIEPIDTVIVGHRQVVFSNIGIKETTEDKKVTRGNHSVTFISKSKKVFYSTLHIPSSGTGVRTIQMDGVSSVAVLEE